MSGTTSVRVRFPPSPTGYCHVGTARMALVNYLFARKAGGSIIFRSEDTDRERSKKEYEDDIIEQLRWLGLSWEVFYRSTEVVERHAAIMRDLIAADKAYVSSEESKKEPGTMVEVVRLRNPGKTVTFADVIRGDISVDTSDLGDFVIGRTIRDPLYNFAVVVDDAADGITHVIRGEDHISNTPRQILIQEALGYARPVYAHFPLHLAADRSKLSKRKGEVAVRSYREQGYLPEALSNYLAVLGWTPPSGREVMSLEDMIGEFELADLHKSGAVFDVEKLRWFNRQYVECMSENNFAAYALPTLINSFKDRVKVLDERQLHALLPLVKERISVGDDIRTMIESGEFDCFLNDPQLDAHFIPEKRSNVTEAGRHLARTLQLFVLLPESAWTLEDIKAAVWDYATAEGRGTVLWPLRYALSGKEKSPDPFTIAFMIGKQATIRRIGRALEMLGI